MELLLTAYDRPFYPSQVSPSMEARLQSVRVSVKVLWANPDGTAHLAHLLVPHPQSLNESCKICFALDQHC